MKTAKVLLGGCAVYAIVATCGAINVDDCAVPASGGRLADPIRPALAHPESGARLKVKRWSGDDSSSYGSNRLLYDSELDAYCEVGRASDGSHRCLPILGRGATAWISNGYVDASCTTRAVSERACGDQPTYVVVKDAAEDSSAVCDPRISVYRVGARLSSMYVRNAWGDCVLDGIPSGRIYYRVAGEIQPHEFVQMTMTTSP